MDKLLIGIAEVISILLVTALFGMLLAFPVEWLWNDCVVPTIPGVKQIDWATAWGIMIICNILIKTSISKQK
jgi:hypothetical protein